MKINSSKIIEVNNLEVSYPSNQFPILKNFRLEIIKKEHTAIIGSSGCGKSTLAKSLVQMLPEGTKCKGNLLVDGKDPRKMNNEELQIFRRTKFGFIYQDSIKRLNPLMTVGDHLYELLKIHWRNKSKVLLQKNVKNIFNKVGIGNERLCSFPHEFSGGMRQRVCIAMALALKPPLLIADEPTTSLDTQTSHQIMNQLLYLCKTYGSTLILISHDIALAAKWCKKLAIIDSGTVVEKGEIKNILNFPQSTIGKELVKSNSYKLNANLSFNKNQELILEAINLRCWYKLNSSIFKPKWNKALNEVSFKLFRNETLGIVGKSGSGKSTLGRALIGLLKKRGGQIKIFLNSFENQKNKRINISRNIQMIFQDPFSSLNPKMTIKDILEDIYLIHNQYNFHQMQKELKSILSKLNLPYDSNFLNSYPDELSGGQLQRISIARALLIKPQILICDESLNMLDASVKIEILYLLRKIQEDMSLSIIFITHDLGLAKRFCNRLLVMNNGEIIEEGYSNDVFEKPKNLITQNLLKSSLNIN